MTRRCVTAVMLQTLVLTNFGVGAFVPPPVLRASSALSEVPSWTSVAVVSSTSASGAKAHEESTGAREEGQRRTPKEIAGKQQQFGRVHSNSNPIILGLSVVWCNGGNASFLSIVHRYQVMFRVVAGPCTTYLGTKTT